MYDCNRTWYHGSQLGDLRELSAGSAVSPSRDVARAFSHRPTLVSAGHRVRHDGRVGGFLYRVSEPLRAEDLDCPEFAGNEDRVEWHVQRPVRVELLEPTRIKPEDLLSDEEIGDLRRRSQANRAADTRNRPL